MFYYYTSYVSFLLKLISAPVRIRIFRLPDNSIYFSLSHTHARTDAHTYTHTHIPTFTHTITHTHSHTYIHTYIHEQNSCHYTRLVEQNRPYAVPFVCVRIRVRLRECMCLYSRQPNTHLLRLALFLSN